MTNSPKLDLLGTEVVALILEYVDDTSPKTTNAVKLTNKFLYSVVHLISNRHKTLQANFGTGGEGLPAELARWSRDDELLANIRTLTVNGTLPAWPQSQDNLRDAQIWRPLAHFIASVGRLRLLIWNLPSIPPSILDVLHSSQIFAKLRMFNFTPVPEDEPSDIEKAIAKSPALTHLRSVFGREYYLHATPLRSEMALQRIIARAPLEFVSVNNRAAPGAAFDPDKLALRSRYLTHRKPNSTIRTLTLDGYPISKKTLDEWSTIVNLSSLETVKFSRGVPSIDYFQNAATMLPSVKNVSLNLRGLVGMNNNEELVAAMQDYLYGCPELETLSLWSWSDFLELAPLLARHGTTLRSLQLHDRENYSTTDPRKPLSVGQLQLIVQSCPTLKDLTIDLNRPSATLAFGQEDRNSECYEILRAAKLDSLQIYLDCGIAYMMENPRLVYRSWNSVSTASDSSDEYTQSDDATEDNDGDDNDNNNDGNDHNNGQPDDGRGHDSNTPSPTGQPAPKRRKYHKPMRPSSGSRMKSYAESIWLTVYKDCAGGPRKLDVKFGEWETLRAEPPTHSTLFTEEKRRTRHFMIRPSERDDQRGQCSIVVRKFDNIHDR